MKAGGDHTKEYLIHECRSCEVKFDARCLEVDRKENESAQALVNYEFYKPNFTEVELSTNLHANEGILNVFQRYFLHRDNYVEIGVGLGFLSRAASATFRKVTGLDLEVETAYSLGKIPDNVRFLEHDSYDTASEDPISALCAWHVMEHLPRPHEVLAPLLRRVLRSGVFFGQVPLFKFDHVFDAHFVFYTEASIIKLLQPYCFGPIYFERDETNDFLSFCFRRF